MNVLMIEDDPEIIESVSIAFQLRWPEVTLISSQNGKNGIEQAEKKSPDIVILDLGLPDMDGFQVLRQIRTFSNVPVVILTVRGEEINKIRGLEMGADDYIVKPFSPGEFLARLRAVLRRADEAGKEDEESGKPMIKARLRIDLATQQVSIGDRVIRISPREFDMLKLLIQNDGRPVSNEELLKVASDPGENLSNSFLEKLIDRLRRKIEDNPDEPGIIVAEGDTGYRLAG